MALIFTVRATAVKRAVGAEREGVPEEVTQRSPGTAGDLTGAKWKV